MIIDISDISEYLFIFEHKIPVSRYTNSLHLLNVILPIKLESSGNLCQYEHKLIIQISINNNLSQEDKILFLI